MQLIGKDPRTLYRNSTWSSLCPNRTVQNQVCKLPLQAFLHVASTLVLDGWYVGFEASNSCISSFSLNCLHSTKNLHIWRADHPVVTIALAFGLLKLQAAHQCMYVGWQLHVSYIPGLTVGPLHFVLHRKWQKQLTGIWLVAVCKYFLPELWLQNCLGEDSHFMTNWSLSSSIPFLSLSLCSSTIGIWFMLGLQPHLLCSCFHSCQFSQPLSFSYFLLACVQPIFEQ
jgi:hypothetical protein